jgi:hypothetical protein
MATGRSLRVVKDHADALYAVAYSPDGKWLATGSADRSVKLWDTATEKRRYSLSGHNDIVYGLAFAPDSKTLASASADKTVRIWEIGADEGKQQRSLGGHGHTVHSVAYSTDGKWLASGSADGNVRIWEPGNGKGEGVDLRGRHPGRRGGDRGGRVGRESSILECGGRQADRAGVGGATGGHGEPAGGSGANDSLCAGDEAVRPARPLCLPALH